MKMTLLKEKQESEFQKSILEAWHEAHGTNTGRVYLCWGEKHVVVILEDFLLKAELLLAQSAEGKNILEQYLQELLMQMIESHETTWPQMLGRVIVDKHVCVNPIEEWASIIFHLGE